MGVLITLIVVALVMPTILLVVYKFSINDKFSSLDNKVDSLHQKMDRITENEMEQSTDEGRLFVQEETENKHQPPFVTPSASEPEKDKKEEVEQPKNVVPKKPEEELPEINTPKLEEPKKQAEPFPSMNEQKPKVAAFSAPSAKKKAKPFQSATKKKDFNFEKFIGENLLNKIGIGILVLGIAFFVKYAIDQNWIGEMGRVAIGLFSGSILVGIAHKIRKTYKAFSSVLIGGGLATYYFTMAIGFHEYQLFSQPVAFAFMVVITAFSVMLSLAYNKQELAVLAIIGGFATPFIVSNGSGNHHVLFTYLLTLNIGMVVLSYFKKWKLINIVSYSLTIITYMVWLFNSVVDINNAPYLAALGYAGALYLVFFIMHIIFNLKEGRKFNGAELVMLFSNTFFFYTAGMWILQASGNNQYQGLFTIVLALKNLAFVLPIYKNKQVDKNLVYTLIAFVMVFTSLAAPIQLEGNHITLFWAVEAVALLWLGQKSGLKLIKGVAILLLALMSGSLIMDWDSIYTAIYTQKLSIAFNRGFITGISCLVAIQAAAFVLKPFQGSQFMWDISINSIRKVLHYSLVPLGYVVGALEWHFQTGQHTETSQVFALWMLMYHLIFIVAMVVAGFGKQKTFNYIASGLGFVAIVSYLITDTANVNVIRNSYLLGEQTFTAFAIHYINLALAIGIIGALVMNIRKLAGVRSEAGNVMLWLLAAVAVYICSAELNQHVLLLRHEPGFSISNITAQTHKVGYPILWGMLSFAFMWVGMKKKLLTARIISLVLFFIVLLKLFVYDIQGISDGGKIAAFICLGILLLTISFMYQKLKGLLFDNDTDLQNTEL